MIVVNAKPAITPRSGFSNFVRICVNCGTSLSGSTAELIAVIPYIRIANPSKIVPMLCFFSLLQNTTKIAPITARIGVKEVGFNI